MAKALEFFKISWIHCTHLTNFFVTVLKKLVSGKLMCRAAFKGRKGGLPT